MYDIYLQALVSVIMVNIGQTLDRWSLKEEEEHCLCCHLDNYTIIIIDNTYNK